MAETWTVEIKQENEIINGEIMSAALPYTLPVATDTVLGGVMPEKKSEVMNKVVGVDEQGRLWTEDSKQDLTGYATEDYVSQAIEKIELMPGPVGPKGNDGAPGPQGVQGEKGEPGQSGVYFGKDEPTDENVNVWVRDTDNSDNVLNFVSYTPQALSPEQQAQARQNIGAIEAPETADVGQTIVVKEVDENGKPTAWETADFPIEGKWELIASGTVEGEARGIELTLDNDGNPFELTKAALHVTNIRRGTEMTVNVACSATLGSVFWSAGVVSAQEKKYTGHREFIAYANTNGSAWLAVRESENANRGPMIRTFSDFIGKTITKAEFMAAAAHFRLAAGLTYELWGVRK